jgi:hypothetical protein
VKRAKQEILAGIAAYGPEQKWLLRQIEVHGGKLTAPQFDSLMHGGSAPPPRVSHYTPETFILGGMAPSEWAIMLDLLQTMAAADLISIAEEAGVITYRAARTAKARL